METFVWHEYHARSRTLISAGYIKFNTSVLLERKLDGSGGMQDLNFICPFLVRTRILHFAELTNVWFQTTFSDHLLFHYSLYVFCLTLELGCSTMVKRDAVDFQKCLFLAAVVPLHKHRDVWAQINVFCRVSLCMKCSLWCRSYLTPWILLGFFHHVCNVFL